MQKANENIGFYLDPPECRSMKVDWPVAECDTFEAIQCWMELPQKPLEINIKKMLVNSVLIDLRNSSLLFEFSLQSLNYVCE